jgi:hypothetical protein
LKLLKTVDKSFFCKNVEKPSCYDKYTSILTVYLPHIVYK